MTRYRDDFEEMIDSAPAILRERYHYGLPGPPSPLTTARRPLWSALLERCNLSAQALFTDQALVLVTSNGNPVSLTVDSPLYCTLAAFVKPHVNGLITPVVGSLSANDLLELFRESETLLALDAGDGNSLDIQLRGAIRRELRLAITILLALRSERLSRPGGRQGLPDIRSLTREGT